MRKFIRIKTNRERIDALIERENAICGFEFKLYGTREEALWQIKAQKYYEKFMGQNKKIYLLGEEFDQEERNIGQWSLEEKN